MQTIIRAHNLKKLAVEIFKSVDVSSEHAEIIADSLINADLKGIYSHGVSRIPIYLQRLQLGLVNPNPELKVVKETAATMVLDGDNGFGQVTSYRAMNEAIKKAKNNMVGIVGVNNSNHFGAASYYASFALESDLIGFACSNTTPLMPAPGGREKLVGNNPFSVAIPTGQSIPVVLDMACSAVALGKILLAKNRDEEIPDSWAADSDGQPTKDPEKAVKGLLLPAGGAKGYGLAVIVDIVAGVLTGSAFGKGLVSMYNNFEQKQNCGHLFMAIDISGFIDINTFRDRMNQLIQEIKGSSHRQDVEEIYLPGEIEYNKMHKQMVEGITLDESTTEQLMKVCNKQGIGNIFRELIF